MNIPLKLDTSEMEEWVKQYAALRKVDISNAIARKMGWLLRRAMWYTPVADKLAIKKQLSGMLFGVNAKGKKVLKTVSRGSKQVPLAALITNKRRGKLGKPGLYGKKMRGSINNLIAARMRSCAYLKSGWIEAFNIFKPYASGSSGGKNVPPVEIGPSKPKRYGQPKGRGTFHQDETKPFAMAANEAWTKLQGDAGLRKYAQKALEHAYKEELQDTIQYLNDELFRAANKVHPGSAKR